MYFSLLIYTRLADCHWTINLSIMLLTDILEFINPDPNLIQSNII